MSDLDSTKKQINGPVNVLRLEGKINNVKKVIYLFADFHINVTSQTTCKNIFSQDVSRYMAKNFLKINKESKSYDFFVEIHPDSIQEEKQNNPDMYLPTYKTKYIQEIFKLFQKIFTFDFKENKVLTSKIMKNIRLHYTDIRNYFHEVFWDNMMSIDNACANMWSYGIYPERLQFVIQQTSNLVKNLDLIVNSMTIPKDYKKNIDIRVIREEPYWNNLKELTPEQREQSLKDYLHYLINKITTQYKNKDLQKKILSHIEEFKQNVMMLIEECNKYISECININNKIISTTNKLNKRSAKSFDTYGYDLLYSELINMNAYINSTWSNLHSGLIFVFTKLMDVYFLRRFLDKDYITNVVAYTGAFHSNVYVYVLVKEFNFKITHYSYSKISDIDELNKEIAKTKTSDDISEFIYPPFFTQCSDMSHFPVNFN